MIEVRARPCPLSRCLLITSLFLVPAGCGSGGPRPATESPLPPTASEVLAIPSNGNALDGQYRMGPSDLLYVRVFGAADLGGEVRVTSGGTISLPLIGRVEAGSRTPEELEEAIEDRLREYMWDPKVSVQVLEARHDVESRIYVLGDVRSPGGYPLERGEPISVVQALALAAGLEPTANKGKARIFRERPDGGREEIRLDIGRILDASADDLLLHHRDILYVPNSRPRSAARAVWMGFVRVFTLRGLLY